jgi:hypothetical protein
MSAARKSYRVYCFDGSAMTLTGDLIEARDDAEALEIAKAQRFGSKCEVWEGDRLVAQLEDDRRLA